MQTSRMARLLDTGWPLLLGVLAVALALRLAYVLTLEPRIVVTFEADPLTYDQLARNLLAGRPYVGASFYYPAGTEHPTAFWDPLYPAFLAAIYALAGHDIVVVRLVQVALGVASCWLLYVLGCAIFGPRIALIAAAIMAIYPFLVYYTGQVLTETLFIFLLLALLTLGWHLGQRRLVGYPAVVTLGVLAGLTILTRAEALIFSVILVAWASWRAAPRRGDTPAQLRSLAVALLVLGATLAPWLLFNAMRHGRPVLTTKAGYNLYKYYHPRMTADQRVPSRDIPLPDLTGLTEPQREQRLLRAGWDFMLSHPQRTVRFILAKARLLFKLMPTNEVNRRYALVSLLSYGVLTPFMVVGALLSLRRLAQTWLLLLWVALGSASSIVVFAGIRLRMRIEPILLLFAAVGLVQVVGWLWSRRSGPAPRRPSIRLRC